MEHWIQRGIIFTTRCCDYVRSCNHPVGVELFIVVGSGKHYYCCIPVFFWRSDRPTIIFVLGTPCVSEQQNLVYTHHGILMSAKSLSYLLSRVLAAVKCYHIITYNSHMDSKLEKNKGLSYRCPIKGISLWYVYQGWLKTYGRHRWANNLAPLQTNILCTFSA
jgi:hypothetical protein